MGSIHNFPIFPNPDPGLLFLPLTQWFSILAAPENRMWKLNCHNKYHSPGGLNDKNFVSHSSGVKKSKVMVLAGLVSPNPSWLAAALHSSLPVSLYIKIFLDGHQSNWIGAHSRTALNLS